MMISSPIGKWNKYQVNRNSGSGVVFSRDPLNLINKETRKHTGFVNEKVRYCVPDGMEQNTESNLI
jgi:hypothetical protein